MGEKEEVCINSWAELATQKVWTFNLTLHTNLKPNLPWHPQREGGTLSGWKSFHGVEDSSLKPFLSLAWTTAQQISRGILKYKRHRNKIENKIYDAFSNQYPKADQDDQPDRLP
jgi:hypothetical protein